MSGVYVLKGVVVFKRGAVADKEVSLLSKQHPLSRIR